VPREEVVTARRREQPQVDREIDEVVTMERAVEAVARG
jgi:hypothetical protein